MKQSIDLSSALERLIAQIKQITTLYESAFQPDTLNAALSQMAASLKETSALYSETYCAQFSELIQSSIDSMRKNDFSFIAKSLDTQSLNNINDALTYQLEPLINAINSIHVIDNCVEMPKQLIPDNFDYDEEITPPIQNKSLIKLPSEKALSIISLLITILIAYISYCQNLSPAAWQEKYHQEEMENDATIIQQNEEMLKIQQKQYEAISKELELLGSIYDQLKSNSKELPASDCIPPEAGSLLQEADSLPHCIESHYPDDYSNGLPAESQPSTTPHSPDGSEPLLKSD